MLHELTRVVFLGHWRKLQHDGIRLTRLVRSRPTVVTRNTWCTPRCALRLFKPARQVCGFESLARIPTGLDLREASGFVCAGLTCYNALRKTGATAGDIVAIQVRSSTDCYSSMSICRVLEGSATWEFR